MVIVEQFYLAGLSASKLLSRQRQRPENKHRNSLVHASKKFDSCFGNSLKSGACYRKILQTGVLPILEPGSL
jgi:hypothetical protein